MTTTIATPPAVEGPGTAEGEVNALEFAGAPSRIGVVDIGSNSVRLAIFDRRGRSIDETYAERWRPQIGRGVTETGRLEPARVDDALGALARFRVIADRRGVEQLYAVATAAVRLAVPEDREAFTTAAAHILRTSIEVVSGQGEARYTAQGVLSRHPGASGFVADIGGISLEIVPVAQSAILDDGVSLPLGPLALMDPEAAASDEGDHPAPPPPHAAADHIDSVIEDIPFTAWTMPAPAALYGVGGAWRNLAACDMIRAGGALQPVAGYSMHLNEALETLDVIAAADETASQIMTDAEVSRRRQLTLPYSAFALAKVLRAAPVTRVVVSLAGLREGVALDRIAAAGRSRPRRRATPSPARRRRRRALGRSA